MRLFGTNQYSNKTGSVAVPPNSTIHAQLLRLVEEMHRCKVKVRQIRLDNQFDTVETRKWAAAEGVLLEFTCPYQHHQNGVQERKNRTVEQAARACMDSDVCGGHINQLPYAMVQAADVINLW
jgi:hypothetical protein